ncbi:MAG: 23S rRNA (guanosine(2251)-2'-O)-methyltransferase RlmB [Bacilli bacterium]|nr:23S rRNA (guanosine(2251)-2'-O)-methyltransferase RlmB [Bacilli bacterium]
MSEIIYGTNLVAEAIKQQVKINNLRICGNNIIKNLAKEKKIPYLDVDKNELNKITSNHQGVIAEVESFPTYSLEEISFSKKDLVLALDGVEDPHNLGAILRTADAAGIKAVILPKNRTVRLNSTVARVSTGAIFSVKCVEVVNLVSALKRLKNLGFWVYGADNLPESQPYSEIKYDSKSVLVLGGEGRGLSRLTLENCDFLIKIPMAGSINSLNVSVSAGILIYQIKNNQ